MTVTDTRIEISFDSELPKERALATLDIIERQLRRVQGNLTIQALYVKSYPDGDVTYEYVPNPLYPKESDQDILVFSTDPHHRVLKEFPAREIQPTKIETLIEIIWRKAKLPEKQVLRIVERLQPKTKGGFRACYSVLMKEKVYCAGVKSAR